MAKFNFFFICILLVSTTFCTGQNQISPYKDFLNTQNRPAKEYILDLFKTHDIVIICERDHRDITQYDLFLDIIRDKRFIKNVGNVFTEVGVSNLNPALNDFLHTKDLPAEEQQRQILNFHRNLNYDAIWEKYNYTYFLQNLYKLNNQLPAKDAVNLYPSDVPLDWQKTDSANYKSYLLPLLRNRDSIIAEQVIERLNTLPGKPKKALVIMNYRHAFNRNFYVPEGYLMKNATGFLFKRYGNKAANVLLNTLVFDRKGNPNLVQQGKWDAAFAAIGNKMIGFNLMNTPFGKDSFDLWPYSNTGLSYQDFFTGFIFYQPIEMHKLISGIPGFLDSNFFDEFFRRLNLSRLLNPGVKYFSKEEIETFKSNPEEIEKQFNEKKEYSYQGIDSLVMKRSLWLK